MGSAKVKQDPALSSYGMGNLMQSNRFLGNANSILSQGPVTTLPSNMQSNVNLPDAVTEAGHADARLPAFLRMNAKNELFSTPSSQIAQNYGNKLYNYEMAPQLGGAAVNAWLGGNLGTSGSSTFGADYLSNLDASARQDSFLGGQQYYDDLLNNFLNERNNYFGNEVQPALQAEEFNQQQNLAGLGMLNNFNLDAAGLYNGMAGTSLQGAQTAYNQNNQQVQEQIAANAAKAASIGGLFTGGAGLIGGLIGLGTGHRSGGGGGGGGGFSPISSSPMNFSTLTQDPIQPFMNGANF